MEKMPFLDAFSLKKYPKKLIESVFNVFVSMKYFPNFDSAKAYSISFLKRYHVFLYLL
jgi:hypothetical protein